MNSGSKVLVTGATGFIGGHLLRYFATETADVIAATRDGRDGSRRFDLLDPDSMPTALDGIDAVVHCAVGNREVNVGGTRVLLAAAAAAGVRRVIHFSTISVYAQKQGEVSENSERVSPVGSDYAHSKSAVEDICLAAAGVEVVRLRPAIVYGPGSFQWVHHYAQRIRSGRWGTFGEIGEGLCNLVHVSDVATSVAAAITAPAASGAAFNINGPEAISWNSWFSRLAKVTGAPPLCPIAIPVLRARSLTTFPHKLLRKAGIRVADRWMLGTPSPGELALYSTRAHYPITAAASGLGWTPRIAIDEGLQSCLPLLRKEGLA